MDSSQAELLARIEAFALDEPDATFQFSHRLARDNGWLRGYGRRVVDEYKRFAFLAMAAGHPVTPSEAVDQAWHLHLCYTESYWKHFCRETLGRPLHHGPTRGGAAEHAKHHDWYERTLASYRRLFGAEPPPDIWPAVDERFAGRYVRIDARENWVIPKPRWWPWARAATLLVTASLLAVGCRTVGVGAIPFFDLTGPEFLRFFTIAAVAAGIGAGVLRRRLRAPGGSAETLELPTDRYSIACLAAGAMQTINAAIVHLAQLRLVNVGEKGALKRVPGAKLPANAHPLEREIFAGLNESTAEELRRVRARVQPQVDEVLDDLRERGLVLSQAQARKARRWPMLLALSIPALGVIKIAVGLSRDRPVAFLVVLTIISLIAFLAIFCRRVLRTRRGDRALALLRTKFSNMRRADFFQANATPDAVALAVGLFGLGMLSNTGYAELNQRLTPPASASGGCSTGCGSGCGGGGSSGCGGGGGCGGCGGGGD